MFLKSEPFLRLTILWFKKIKVDYTFESIPVLSTFVPNKATPSNCNAKKVRSITTLSDGGIGNQSYVQFNLSTMVPLDRMQSIGLEFLYNKSEPWSNATEQWPKKNFFDLLINTNKTIWVDSDLRFDRQGHNFFGFMIWLAEIPSFKLMYWPSQNLNYLSIRSRWQWYEGLFSKVNFNTHITTDSFDSTEHIVKINSQMRIPFSINTWNWYLTWSWLTPIFRAITMIRYWNFKKEWADWSFSFWMLEKLKLLLGAKGLPFWRYGRRHSDIFCLS